MKKHIKYLIWVLLFFPFSGCDVDDQLLQDAPESNVLFAKNILEQEIYKAPNMIDFKYNLYVYRSGVKNGATIQANISVSEAALANYNTENQTSFQLLPEAYYAFNNSVTIQGGSQTGISEVTIRADKIANELGFDDDFAIPFIINESAGVSTAEDNNVVILKVNVREPVIRQQVYGLQAGSAVGNANYSSMLNIFVEFENEWDIELGFEVDYSLVEAYNLANSTNYPSLPQANVSSLPASFTLASGTKSVNVNLGITTAGLEYFDPYLLPLRLVSKGEFPVDSSREIIYLLFTRNFDQQAAEVVPLTNDMIETFTQEGSEGPKENLVDGNPATYWHSSWSSGVSPLPHHIQINFDNPTELGGLNYTFRQPSGITDRPNQFDIQTSSDGETWTTVWTSKPNLPVAPVDEMRTLIFDQNYSARYFRVRILATYGNRDWTHLSTLEVFRVKN